MSKGLTSEEIARVEFNSYIVRIGNDIYNKNGTLSFSLAQAEKHYYNLLRNIIISIDSGTTKQRNAAMKCLEKLQILPLRLH
jgi:hypothetical protein